MKPFGDFPKVSIVSPVAKTILLLLTSRHVPYNSSFPAFALVETRKINMLMNKPYSCKRKELNP
jgi:hypothetical protein